MTSTRTAETGIAFRTFQPGQFPRPTGISVQGADGPAAGFSGNGDGVPDRLSEYARVSRIDLSPDEARELDLFDDFLGRHVHQNENCDVQCMLLWNEWVRTFRRQVSRFPALIREKEFRSAITGKFSAGIATDGWRGNVFTGIGFRP